MLINGVTCTLGTTPCTISGGGNVSTSGSPAQFQTAVFASGTTIGGIGPGTSGYPYISNGGGANPSFQQLNVGGAGITGVMLGANGGTGINNGSLTITLGGDLTLSGAFNLTLTQTANTNVTLPTSGTLCSTTTCISNPMTTLGDVIYGAASGAPTRLAGPTTAGTYVFTQIPSGGVATAEQWLTQGVPVTKNTTGTPFTLTAAANLTLITQNSASAAAYTGPALANSEAFSLWNYLGAGTVTYTPATGTINSAATMTIPTGWFAPIYTDNANSFSPLMPTVAAFPTTATGYALNFNGSVFGTVAVGGGSGGPLNNVVAVKTSSYALTDSDGTIICKSGPTITVPSSPTTTTRQYIIKNFDTANACTVTSGSKIDTSTTFVLAPLGGAGVSAITIQYDSTDSQWIIE
jgi:uncharacterized protein GlcG (DUF336 family)